MVKTVTRVARPNTFGLCFPTKSSPQRPLVKKNPFFDECLERYSENDKIWIRILQDAALGKFPHHFRYNKDEHTLTYSYQKKKENLKLNSDPEIAVNEFVAFLQEHGHIFSKKDQIKDEIVNNKIKWIKVKGTVKTNLIDGFVAHLCQKHHLNDSKYLEIKNDINLALMIGRIKPEDIKIEHNLISEIVGVCWNSKKSKLEIKSNSEIKIKPDRKVFKSCHLGKTMTLEDIFSYDFNLKSKSDAFIKSFIKNVYQTES